MNEIENVKENINNGKVENLLMVYYGGDIPAGAVFCGNSDTSLLIGVLETIKHGYIKNLMDTKCSDRCDD